MIPADIWGILYGLSLLTGAYFIYNTKLKAQKVARDGGTIVEDLHKSVGIFYSLIGLYSLITGIWATFAKPFSIKFNTILADLWPIFGLFSLFIGLSFLIKINEKYITNLIPVFGVIALIYGIIASYLIANPIISAIYILSGIAGILTPWINRRVFAISVLVLIIIAGLLSIGGGIYITLI